MPCVQGENFMEVIINIPAIIYFFKNNNRITGKRCEICSKLTINIRTTSFWCFYRWLLNLFHTFFCVSVVDFEQVNVSWNNRVLQNDMKYLKHFGILFKETFLWNLVTNLLKWKDLKIIVNCLIYSLFIRTSKILMRLNVLIFWRIVASKCSHFVLNLYETFSTVNDENYSWR